MKSSHVITTIITQHATQYIIVIAITLIEMCGCDWFKSRASRGVS